MTKPTERAIEFFMSLLIQVTAIGAGHHRQPRFDRKHRTFLNPQETHFMASLSKDRGKRGITRRVLFRAADGSRKAIHLGDVTAKSANTILAHVDLLERCLIDGSAPPTATVLWLESIGDALRAKF